MLALLASASSAEPLQGGYPFAGRELAWYATSAPTDSPRSPVLLLLEGDGSRCQPYRRWLWEEVLEDAAGSWTVVRPVTLANARCGRRDWRRTDLGDRADEVEAIVASLRAAGLDGPLVLVGHSAGARVAALYAARHPGGTAAVVVLAGSLDGLAATLRLAVDQRAADGVITAEQRDAELVRVEATLAQVAASDPNERIWRRTAGFWQQMMFTDFPTLWRSLGVPILAVHGAEDRDAAPVLGFTREQRTFADLPGLSFVLLPGLGHDLLRPEAFVEIGAWLERVLYQPSR